MLLAYLFALQTICSARWRKFHIFSIWVFLIKQHFQKGTLKFIEETIELQKNQNWIKANKLILNSCLAFNPKMQEIAGKSWILTKSQSGKAKSSI